MKVGTRSVLFGAHCFLIHPLVVAVAWWKLFGFPSDPRQWFAFFLHDIGYIGKPNIDGREGEMHPELGARIMGRLFDGDIFGMGDASRYRWHDFTLFHSRHYAKREGREYSRLCVADKFAFCIEPWWLYLPRAWATGEIHEYVNNANSRRGIDVQFPTMKAWHDYATLRTRLWVEAHKNGEPDSELAVRYPKAGA